MNRELPADPPLLPVPPKPPGASFDPLQQNPPHPTLKTAPPISSLSSPHILTPPITHLPTPHPPTSPGATRRMRNPAIRQPLPSLPRGDPVKVEGEPREGKRASRAVDPGGHPFGIDEALLRYHEQEEEEDEDLSPEVDLNPEENDEEGEEEEPDEIPDPGLHRGEAGFTGSSLQPSLFHKAFRPNPSQRLCRVCGQETQTNRKVHFFTQTGIANNYRNRLISAMRFLNNDPTYDILELDKLPQFFCRKCHTRLLSFERAALNLRSVYLKGMKVFRNLEARGELPPATVPPLPLNPSPAPHVRADPPPSSFTGPSSALTGHHPGHPSSLTHHAAAAAALNSISQRASQGSPPRDHRTVRPNPSTSFESLVPSSSASQNQPRTQPLAFVPVSNSAPSSSSSLSSLSSLSSPSSLTSQSHHHHHQNPTSFSPQGLKRRPSSQPDGSSGFHEPKQVAVEGPHASPSQLHQAPRHLTTPGSNQAQASGADRLPNVGSIFTTPNQQLSSQLDDFNPSSTSSTSSASSSSASSTSLGHLMYPNYRGYPGQHELPNQLGYGGQGHPFANQFPFHNYGYPLGATPHWNPLPSLSRPSQDYQAASMEDPSAASARMAVMMGLGMGMGMGGGIGLQDPSSAQLPSGFHSLYDGYPKKT